MKSPINFLCVVHLHPIIDTRLTEITLSWQFIFPSFFPKKCFCTNHSVQIHTFSHEIGLAQMLEYQNVCVLLKTLSKCIYELYIFKCELYPHES